MRYVIAGLLLVTAAVVPTVVFSSNPTADAADLAASGPLVVCDGQQDALRFVLKPGGRIERDIWIENRSAEVVTISKIESSCDCVSVKTPLTDLSFAVLGRKSLRLAVEIAEVAPYRGSFAPQLILIHAKTSPGLGIVIELEIIP